MNGLPKDGGTCPGATLGKGGCMSIIEGRSTLTCYVDKVKRIYSGVNKVLTENTELIIEKSYEEILDILRNTIKIWYEKKGYKAPYFRLHWSGDFVNKDYLKAWVTVIKENPKINFWVYTRSFFAVPDLADCENLALYISVDEDNKYTALKAYEPYKDYKNVNLAWMGNDKPSIEGKFISCPEISGKVKNEKDKGACSKCKLCFTHNKKIKLRAIQFTIH